MSVTYINIPNNPHTHRQFYTTLNDVYLNHNGRDVSDGSAFLINLIHNNKLVKAGIDKDTQKFGDPNIYYSETYQENPTDSINIDDEVFLLYDDAGLNYAHFYFDLFGKCYYFDLLKKQNPNIKLGVVEEFWVDEGKNNFIKQWLKIYYGNDLDAIVFKKNKSYNIKTIHLPNCFYWFPEGYGHEPIIDMVKSVTDKIEPLPVTKRGCYISRQDTIKYGWYHKRDLINELELIDKIKSELDYDILELMDYDVMGKIQISKSYKNIIQQNSASNINVIFSGPKNTQIILSNPRMAPWLNFKVSQFSEYVKTDLIYLDDIGKYLSEELDPTQGDNGNNPWEIVDIEGVVGLLKQIDDGSIWSS